MSEIFLREVVKRWGSTPAVDGINLHVPHGELVTLLGPSGCGKSTTLRLIAGLEAVDGGEIDIGGRRVTRLAPAERGVAMVFQSYALFPHLSVADNILFGLRVRRVPATERAARLQRAAELLGLSTLLERRPAQLSGGQRQRVALGRAIVAEAPVCLMDEPLSNLDAQLRQQMRAEIRALQQRLGMTMVYVTHDQTEAMTMADKVVLMRQGRIEQEGSPAELYERPASAFVAGFIGAPPMNLLPVPDDLPLPGGRPPHEWWLGVRPEHIGLCQPECGLPATLEAVEYLGAESMLICRHADTAQRIAVRAPGRVSARPGDTLGLEWHPNEQHLFSRADGLRLRA
ncbi:MAG: ABC transporter ATP-binding protein [Candidatus Dactylopiibacterium carminicum]|uniref:ABC transporter ATP-binding protein n=1 Tax=Candidatus Dactylopiibacterium carminicum TaxID=857335 RepID=A0A272ERY7_9RHOO|nr:ABC transporter ATP-binding protein [Candidatus Dactylopiibacterium carminicum]KAF7598946.1 ABC transporter ATP-binding protein [Candidatus Dactylopiibacterium carminicum]PAS92867.1 MAG: ABC transporter ATP-binding protein [Candidatus Dactylopiibacterium carminicum]PAS96373.1 MAG: ABC transporter ATP-binding protein [Candidatus Dactylopiibacterium carminicum]PAS98964.1 MAG: ABC transporter ATP-binding protein [Candidatus Dactylopiibacterium carminicum]